MAHFINASQISPKLRQPHIARYKSQLRAALLSPGMSADQVARIRGLIAQAGKPKSYDPSLPAPNGAIR